MNSVTSISRHLDWQCAPPYGPMVRMGDSGDKNLSLPTLGTLPLPALRKAFVEAIGRSPPKRCSRDFLIGNIAWHFQTTAQKKRPAMLQARILAQLRKLPISRPSFKPGTRLIREWHGETYEVTVLEKGFAWRGNRYDSLSEIARTITGAHWSGPRFFALK